jgi:hypothetical protein
MPADVESNSDVDDKQMDEEDNDSDIVEAEEDDDRDEYNKARSPCLLSYFESFVLGSCRGAQLMASSPCVSWCIHGILLAKGTIPYRSGSATCCGILLMPPRSISNTQKWRSSAVASDKKGGVYLNPFKCDIYHIFMLALYLATAFTEKQSRGCKLFRGLASTQSRRAAKILKRILKENEDKVLQMGYDSIDNIGLHSTCKGAALYLASLPPGGPMPTAVCL